MAEPNRKKGLDFMYKQVYNEPMRHEQRKKSGRPKLPDDVARRERVELRLTAGEMKRIRVEAQRRNCTITDVLLAPFREGKTHG